MQATPVPVSIYTQTPRLKVHALEAGNPEKELIVLVHGNVSSSAFFAPLMEQLANDFYVLAPDLRGFGQTDPAPVDATRGIRDFSDDLAAFLHAAAPGRRAHLVGWSLGSGVALQFAIDHHAVVASLTLESGMSPFGFGGTYNTGLEMQACAPDFAGTGGATANPVFVDCLRTRDCALPSTQPEGLACNPQFHARTVMNAFYFTMPEGKTLAQLGVISQTQEDAFTEAMFAITLGDDNYPGDFSPSEHWPNVAPGTRGVNNALSPKYFNLSGFAQVPVRIPVLWIRGDSDQIVSDTSLFDLNYLGSLGLVPGWPGAEVAPPQPMVTQLRTVLEAYSKNSGSDIREVVFTACGHSPHIEQQGRFLELLYGHVGAA
jgi:pimeloyl-ACP methyl ester carboxylesterase